MEKKESIIELSNRVMGYLPIAIALSKSKKLEVIKKLKSKEKAYLIGLQEGFQAGYNWRKKQELMKL